jgi:cellulose synthase/poly-beta-1,6-N-acetylglucosamine synthase-like glycosyltransferase
VKDEDPYMPEWIEYHLKIGVTQFYIYNNGSQIPLTTSLKKYIDLGVVTPEVIEGVGVQTKAHAHCLEKYGSQCQWIAFIDADEFLVPKTLTGSLPDFLTAYEPYGGLAVNWLVFGSNGHIESRTGRYITIPNGL